MKYTQKVLSAGVAGLSLLAASSAMAIPATSGFNYQDINAVNTTVNVSSSYTGSFNIVNGSTTTVSAPNGFGLNGVSFTDITTFDNTVSTITSANVYFYIENANSANDLLTINLTDENGFFSGKASDAKVIIGNSLNSAAITFLNNNGTLSYTITNTGSSDFKVGIAQLQVYTGAKNNSQVGAPDGGSTVALLGAGLLGCGLLGVRRRVLKPAKK